MKLRYSMTFIILTSVVTSQNMDAAYLWQRVKDTLSYRWPSLFAGTGLGYYAYTAQDPKYKALAGLCAAGLLGYACATAPDTSTLEGLVALAAHNIGYRAHNKTNITDLFLIRTKLIREMKNNSSESNKPLQNQILALEKLLQKLESDITHELAADPQYTMVNGRLNKEGGQEYLKRYTATLDSFINNPSSIKNNGKFKEQLEAIENPSSSQGFASRVMDIG